MSSEEKKIRRKNSPEIKIVNVPLCDSDKDPVLLRKEQEAIKSFYETPWPDCVLKRMVKED